MDIDSGKVKDLAIEAGADLVGIASADCVDTSPTRRGPKNVLPEAQSVVVFATRMLVASIDGPSVEVLTYQNLAAYQELERISYSLGRVLEKEGYRAATVPAYSPVEMSLETKGFVGAVSLRHVAEAAGLGKLGRSNLLITPDLGPRVRLGAVVTTASLNPNTPLSEGFCEDCKSCVDACPVGALSEPGMTRTGRCVRQILPYGLANVVTFLTKSLDSSKEEIKGSFLDPEFWNMYQSLQMGMQYGCHICMNACPVGTKPV
jgi:epoxyqueuosine reductase QueG